MSMRVVPTQRSWFGHPPLYRKINYFGLSFFTGVIVLCWSMQKLFYFPNSSEDGLNSVCDQAALYFCKLISKKCGNHAIYYVWMTVWCFQNGFGRWIADHFDGFFHQIKWRQQIGRKDSIKRRLSKMWGLEGFLY
jgi:hypothetical protein